MLRPVLVVLSLVSVVALAGCDKFDEPVEESSSPTTAPTTTSATTTTTTATTTSSSSSMPPRRDPVTWNVTLQGNDFVEGSLTVQRGDTVRWLHRDGTTPHTVSADGGEFDSGSPFMIQAPTRDTFQFTFDDGGEFPYHCQVHSSMTDAITVLERSDAVPAQ